MPIAVGIDLVEVEEVEEALRRHGERYLRRIYTDHEQRDCEGDPRRLAARFAAKEATMKALRRSGEPLPWRAIGVRMGPAGQPELELTGAAAQLADDRGVNGLSVSLNRGRGDAAALVLAECAR
ncbi:MAG: holo-ACP synthase [Solirubrobacteraceae bacterium]